MNETVRKWAALVVVLMTMLAADVAIGEDYSPCYEAYLESGLTAQQMSFDQFRHSYSDSLCAKGEEASGMAHEARALRASR